MIIWHDSCHITQLMYNPSDHYWTTYVEKVYKAVLQYGGRPHWGKSYYMGRGDVGELYPKLTEFLEVWRTLDPDGVFLTNHIINTFSL